MHEQHVRDANLRAPCPSRPHSPFRPLFSSPSERLQPPGRPAPGRPWSPARRRTAEIAVKHCGRWAYVLSGELSTYYPQAPAPDLRACAKLQKLQEATGGSRQRPLGTPAGRLSPPRSPQFALTFVHHNTYGVIHNLACLRARDLTPCFYPTPCYTLHPRGPHTTPQGWKQGPLEQAHSRHSAALHSSIPPSFHPSHPHIHLPPPWRSALSRASHSPRWCHPYARNIA